VRMRTIAIQLGSITLLMLLCAMPGRAADRFQETLDTNGTRLAIDFDASITVPEREKLMQWLDQAMQTMRLLNGALPRPEIRIVLDSYRRSDDAIPFGKVIRKRPEGVNFYINPERSLDEFVRNWTTYHELSHLFIPYPNRPDVWFSEGLASYYQNVLQYRAGLLTETEAWQKLVSGFERGRQDDQHADLTLTQLSSGTHNRYAFMRIYWSGALYFLEADLQLRAETNNKQSTDTVLKAFGECCIKQRRRWTGKQIAEEFDRLSDSNLFSPLFDQYALSTAMPDYLPILKDAGIELAKGQTTLPVNLSPSHSLAGVLNLPKN
jgi:hypothetical protein